MSETRFLAFARRQRLGGDAITVRAAGGQASFAFQRYGPGDVAKLATDQIKRRQPAAGSEAMPPNLLPYVEFRDADFPWRLSPLDPTPEGELTPWLALITLEMPPGGESPLRHAAAGDLPLIEVACVDLPTSNELSLWAHVEIAPTGSTGPEGGIARIVSPVRLKPLTRYLCCIVPTFKSGRDAGLGDVPPDPLDPALAWPEGDKVRLPVYDSWQFGTLESGDVETLARNLTPKVLEAHPLHADVSEALRPARSKAAPPSTLAPFDPVLRPTSTDPQWSPKAARQRARETIGGWLKRTAAGGVGPPIYGAAVLDGPLTDTGWMGDVNLDPLYRSAAGIGAAMVAAHQDDLSEEAWRQAGAIHKARRESEGAKLAGLVANRLYARSVAPLSQIAATLTLRPALARVAAPGGGPVAAALALSALPSANLSAAFGRILKAKAGPARAAAAPPFTVALQAENLKVAVLNEVPPTAPSVATRSRLAAFDTTGGGTRGSNVGGTASTSTTATTDRGRGRGRSNRGGGAAGDTRAGAAASAADASLHPATRFSLLNILLDAEKSRMVEAAGAWLNDRAPAVVELATPPAFAWTAPLRPGDVALAAATRRADLGDAGRRLPARGVSIAPRFDQPLVDWIDPRFLLGAVEPDPETVCGLGVNAAFIEAVLIGANHELARELRWRGVPLDLSATFFQRFFDGEVTLSDMAGWQSTPLGEHYPVAHSTVIFFRSKLVEHLSEVTVFLARAKRIPGTGRRGGGRVVDTTATPVPPFFQGRPDQGMAYFGFDLSTEALQGSSADAGWYLVIEEREGGTKFGFDEQAVDMPKTWGRCRLARSRRGARLCPGGCQNARAIHAGVAAMGSQWRPHGGD